MRRAELPDFDRRFLLWHDLDGCRLLLAALFFSELYSAYNQLQTRRENRGSEPGTAAAEKGEGDHTGQGEIVQPCAPP